MEASARAERRVLIIVQNLPVPLDRRVWMECQALMQAGYGVSVICPRGERPEDRSRYEVLDGVHIHRYRAAPPSRGVGGFLYEFAYCWLATLALAVLVYRTEGFDVIQACNPPDTFWTLALLFRPFDIKFVFDQHDMCPEVYQARFARPSRLLLAMLRWLQRWSYRAADHVIVTNPFERDAAVATGRCSFDDVSVVRNAPLCSRFVRAAAVPELRNGRRYLCCYLGVMGPQDGVHIAVQAAKVLVHDMQRDDVQFALLGFGDSFEELQALAHDFGVAPWVHFTGRADDVMIREYLSTADVGLVPDPPTAFNDLSSMNKTVEYMAFSLPLVAFDLRETHATADRAGIYAPGETAEQFAKAIVMLLDNPDRRREMGEFGRAKLEEELAWEHQIDVYIAVYDGLAYRARGSAQAAS
jgi:glycosyltransferase involved in cell wall biosynthesis